MNCSHPRTEAIIKIFRTQKIIKAFEKCIDCDEEKEIGAIEYHNNLELRKICMVD